MTGLQRLARAVAVHGLILRGGFHPEPGADIPLFPDGALAGTVVLVGNVGAAMWRAFAQAVENDGERHSLDRWTRRVLTAVAQGEGAVALFPFGGPPHWPFQRWAMRAEPVAPSPLGLLIHPDYGLWHAYRGAFLLRDRLDLASQDDRPSPCRSCIDRPCLTSCPVDAFRPEGYDVPACRDHLATPEGTNCMSLSCRARRACPVGRDYLYDPEQAAFHMRAFRDPG